MWWRLHQISSSRQNSEMSESTSSKDHGHKVILGGEVFTIDATDGYRNIIWNVHSVMPAKRQFGQWLVKYDDKKTILLFEIQ